MRPLPILALCSLALTLLPQSEPVLQEPAAPPQPISIIGTLIPTEAEQLGLWPQAWSGEWMITEVAAHGTQVQEGQVLARFHARALQEAFERAEADFAAARLEHRISVARAELETDSELERLQTAEAALARAEADFASWREFELPARREQAALADLYGQHGLEDQRDELAQLEAMYGADELTDATEELVLMRSRRNYERSSTQLELARRQRAKTAEHDWVHEDQEKAAALERQRAGFERLRGGAELDAAARRLRVERGQQELDRKERDLSRMREDVGLLTLRAPRSGVLLHGALKDYESGGTPARFANGDYAPQKRWIFTITSGEAHEVSLEVGEELRARSGAAVQLSWAGSNGTAPSGRLSVEGFPTPRSGSADESRYAARVTGLGSVAGGVPGMRVKVQIQP